ncbi:MAG: DUF1289 domain-containing protein [Pseudomonas sp.]
MAIVITKKPCIDICEFDSRNRCSACGRTKQEKKEWKGLSANEKQIIWDRVLASHGSGGSKHAKALRALYSKARKKAESN